MEWSFWGGRTPKLRSNFLRMLWLAFLCPWPLAFSIPVESLSRLPISRKDRRSVWPSVSGLLLLFCPRKFQSDQSALEFLFMFWLKLRIWRKFLKSRNDICQRLLRGFLKHLERLGEIWTAKSRFRGCCSWQITRTWGTFSKVHPVVDYTLCDTIDTRDVNYLSHLPFSLKISFNNSVTFRCRIPLLMSSWERRSLWLTFPEPGPPEISFKTVLFSIQQWKGKDAQNHHLKNQFEHYWLCSHCMKIENPSKCRRWILAFFAILVW